MIPGFHVRPGTPADHNFVLHWWIRSYQGPALRGYSEALPKWPWPKADVELWRADMEALAKALLARGTLTVVGLPDIPDSVCSWAVTTGPTLHYVCTKPRWQRLGLARWLVRELRPTEYTTRTWAGLQLARGLTYRPLGGCTP